MASRANQVKFAALALLALAGTAGTFVFGILAGEGGKYHLLIILLGVLCASAPVVATAIGRQVTNRLLRTEVAARERAVEEREHALASKQVAERQTTEVQINAEARLIFALRARLSPVLYCLGKIAAAAPEVPVDPLIGSLIQAIVAAAVEHRQAVADRRSIFFADDNGVMRCVSYAGYEGQRDAARTTFTDTPDDPVGQQMFRLLAEQEARLIRDLADPRPAGEVPAAPQLPDDHCRRGDRGPGQVRRADPGCAGGRFAGPARPGDHENAGQPARRRPRAGRPD